VDNSETKQFVLWQASSCHVWSHMATSLLTCRDICYPTILHYITDICTIVLLYEEMKWRRHD